MTDNLYQIEARARKARRLVDEATRLGIDATEVATSEEARARLVSATGVNPPSTETWAMVVGLLERGEQ